MAIPNPKNVPVGAPFGLEALPENIAQLSRLVAQQDADLELIGQLIAKDKAMTDRLLKFANPRAQSADDSDITTVEEALMRTGLAPVILLAMLGPLTRAVINAFEMFVVPVTPAAVETLPALAGQHLMATASFTGKGSGLVQLRLSAEGAQRMVSATMGSDATQTVTPSEVNDVIGELASIIGGNLESNLCDAGITCKLAAPQVSRVTNFQKQTLAGGVSERLGFASNVVTAFVDVSVNPWSD